MFCSLAFYDSLNYTLNLWSFKLIEISTIERKNQTPLEEVKTLFLIMLRIKADSSSKHSGSTMFRARMTTARATTQNEIKLKEKTSLGDFDSHKTF